MLNINLRMLNFQLEAVESRYATQESMRKADMLHKSALNFMHGLRNLRISVI